MSLYLPEQKLGSHSSEGGSSNKFILKGRQTGTMHRGHTWVFRAESHDTMMAWYADIKALTEKTPEERSQFVRSHSRSMSQSSRRSASSDGMVDDDDDEPFSASQMDVAPEPRPEPVYRRPEPGGRFPSDIQVNAQRGLQAAQSPSSVSSGHQEYPLDSRALAASGVPPAASYAGISHGQQDRGRDEDVHMGYGGTSRTPMDDVPSQAAIASQEAYHDGVNPYTSEPARQITPAQQSGGYFVAPIVASHTCHSAGEAAMAERGSPNLAQETHAREVRMADHEVDAYEKSQSGNGSLGSYVNGGIEGDNERVVGMTAGSIPRSETQQELALQSVPEANKVDHTVQGDAPLAAKPTPQRPQETRTTSTTTLSNLPIPGKYPKGSSATSP